MSQRFSPSSMIVVLALATPAGASDEPFVVRVRYEAPTGCPTESLFLNQTLQRARHSRLATGSEPARKFRAVITQDSGKFQARLDFIDPDSRSVSREIEGSTCAEVASALEVITALAIDPLLSNPTRAMDNTASSVGGNSNAKRSPGVPLATVAASEAAAHSAAPSELKPETHRWVPAIGASLGAVSDVAPDWAPTISLFSEVGPARRRSTMRLEFSYAERESSVADGTSAVFRLGAAALEGCPWAGNVVTGLRLWPCAALEAGVFQAAGRASSRLPFPNDISALWLAGDVVLRAQIDLSRSWNLELGGKMRVPMIRNSYVYEHPLIQAFRTPQLGAALYVGVGLRLGG